MNYSDKLRQLADYLDERPKLLARMSTRYDYPHATAFAEDAIDFGRLTQSMGSGDKGRSGESLYFGYQECAEDGERIFSVTAWVSGVCERKPTGRKIERKIHVPEDAVQTDDGAWIVEDDEYEYECPPSFLALAGE